MPAASAALLRDRWRRLASGRWLRLVIVLTLPPTVLHAPAVLSQVRPGASLTVVRGSVAVTQADGTKIYSTGTGLTLDIGDIVAPPTVTRTPTATLTPTPTRPPSTPGPPYGAPTTSSGSSGVITAVHDLGRPRGNVRIDWNAFSEEDQFEISTRDGCSSRPASSPRPAPLPCPTAAPRTS